MNGGAGSASTFGSPTTCPDWEVRHFHSEGKICPGGPGLDRNRLLNPWRPGRSYRPKATRNADAQRARDGTSRPSGTAAGTLQPQWRTIGLMPMKVREVIRLLEKHGWVEMRSRGSHRHFKHPDEAFVITVPGNDGKELAPGTLNVILKKAGLK